MNRLMWAASAVGLFALVSCDHGSQPLRADPDIPGGQQDLALEIAVPDTALRAAMLAAARTPAGGPDLDLVTTLGAGALGIQDLTGIGLLGNLVFADLADNQIVDISPLADLDSLRVLDLTRNRVVDVQPLAGMPKLAWLILDGNPVTQLSPLRSVPQLEQLSLLEVGITDQATLDSLEARGVEVFTDANAAETPVDAFDLTTVRVRALSVGEDGLWYAGGSFAPLAPDIPFIARSMNQGLTWNLLADSALAKAGTDLDLVYAAGDSGQVLMVRSVRRWLLSPDGGRTWSEPEGLVSDFYLEGSYPVSFPEVAFPRGPGSMALLRKVTGGSLYSSDDDGRSWQERRPNVISFHQDPSSGQLTFVEWVESAGRRAMVSTDGGATTTTVVSYDDGQLLTAHVVAEGDALLLGRMDGLYRSELDDESPQLVLSPSRGAWGVIRLRSSPSLKGNVFLVAGDALDRESLDSRIPPFDVMHRTLWRSTDDGNTWQRVEVSAPRDVAIDPDGTIAVLTDVGISISR